MGLVEFKKELEQHLESISDLVTIGMKDTGDKCEHNQKICLLQKVSQLEHYINGIEQEDLV